MPSGTFVADGEIAPRHIFATALLVGRVRHSRALDHYGSQDTTVVVLEQAIGGFPAGTDVQTVLEDLYARLVALEGVNHLVRQFTAGAFIAWYIEANAALRKTISTTTTKADAVLVSYAIVPNSVTANAVIFAPPTGHTFVARAYFVDYVG